MPTSSPARRRTWSKASARSAKKPTRAASRSTKRSRASRARREQVHMEWISAIGELGLLPPPNQTPACRGLVTQKFAGSGQARSRLGEGRGGGDAARYYNRATCEGTALPPPQALPTRGRGAHRVRGANVTNMLLLF